MLFAVAQIHGIDAETDVGRVLSGLTSLRDIH